jgi:hypothetical protein
MTVPKECSPQQFFHHIAKSMKKVFEEKVFVQGGPQQFFEDVFPFP